MCLRVVGLPPTPVSNGCLHIPSAPMPALANLHAGLPALLYRPTADSAAFRPLFHMPPAGCALLLSPFLNSPAPSSRDAAVQEWRAGTAWRGRRAGAGRGQGWRARPCGASRGIIRGPRARRLHVMAFFVAPALPCPPIPIVLAPRDIHAVQFDGIAWHACGRGHRYPCFTALLSMSSPSPAEPGRTSPP